MEEDNDVLPDVSFAESINSNASTASKPSHFQSPKVNLKNLTISKYNLIYLEYF